MILKGILYSSIAGMATSLGALPFLFLKPHHTSDKTIDSFLGFAAGVMIAASAFSLVAPALEMGGIIRFIVGFALGGLFVNLADKLIPHEHLLKGHEGPDVKRLKGIWLFVIAITIHNFPEGMAVGVSAFTPQALSIAIAIGVQNIPEGAAVMASLIPMKYRKGKAFLITFLTGLVEAVGGLLGAGIVSISQRLLPYMMAFAAGAMIYVVSDEVIPETHSKGNELLSTWWIMTGFIVMASLDVALG
ncbi:protein gufA [Thermotoga sp. RQ7]|jgi:ZIP family zinc transporter|uniref:ZIP family metal transporter n=1 Tax=Thermotoga sp. RQ7 TaxID=126738 RepID=UPI0005A34CA2|nr:ZIP family metal transporter [Thermotoga sp. RQ7]AJG41026.1 protein gufA [Thermotoga sp. RQ7]